MAKPIPVFTFVFAAYAATCTNAAVASRRLATRSTQSADPFLEARRARSRRAGILSAKVGLLNGSTPGQMRFALRSSDEVFVELWLDAISETRLGFVGAAQDGPNLPPAIKPGQLLRFHRINVLDWRLGEPAPSGSLQREFAGLRPNEKLAERPETFGG
jgi:hypothetical protein